MANNPTSNALLLSCFYILHYWVLNFFVAMGMVYLTSMVTRCNVENEKSRSIAFASASNARATHQL